jgi:hypothetical protein
MMKRPLLLFVLLALVAAGIVLLRSCGDAAQQDATDAATPSQTGRTEGGTGPDADAAARARAIARQREDAMHAAVSTLHRYLAALGGTDRAAADAFWAGKGPPAASGEADLRSLEKLHSLRSQNGNPKPLDSEVVPNALEIPVELRAGLQGQPVRRYRGWYRMRRAVADGGWEITSASIAPITR